MFQDVTLGADGMHHTWEILIMLLIAFLLGLLLGYFVWRRYKKLYLNQQNINANLRSKLTDMEKDFASLRYKLDEADKDATAFQSRIKGLESDNIA